MKQVKHVVSYVYLSVLQQLTGIEQSWGILTGVRPTKLLHKMLQNGMSKEEAHQELRESYLIHEEKIELLQRIVDCQLAVVPDLYRLKEEVSIYIGIPFCPTKCAYCTFPLMRLMDAKALLIRSWVVYIMKFVKLVSFKRKRCKSYDDLLRRRYTYKYYSRRDGYAV